MHPAYFETRFRCDPPPEGWPDSFAIISAYATTGSAWPLERNAGADESLELTLRRKCDWLWRVVGYSPATDHAEPSWATTLSIHDACEIGMRYLQDAIYWVERDRLFVLQCVVPDRAVFVDTFSRRLDSC